MPSKKFTLSAETPYPFDKVDAWWAGMLRSSPKWITSVEWSALGNLRWELKLIWEPVAESIKLNVGHPAYAGLLTEEIEELLSEVLDDFESSKTDHDIFEAKIKEWGVCVVDGELKVNEFLDDCELMITQDYLWPMYRSCGKHIQLSILKMNELEAELKARTHEDYVNVKVERGMLRLAFEEQVGHENGWLFDVAT